MAAIQRRLILGNGEKYIQPITKKRPGRTPEPPRTYEEARQHVKGGLLAAMDNFAALPATRKIPGEAVFCLRLHPDAMAKSYDPTAIFNDAPQLYKVGSRNYRDSIKNVAPTKRVKKLADKKVDQVEGRLVFVQSSEAGFKQFLVQLDRPKLKVPIGVQEEIRRIERFDILTAEERIAGFAPGWEHGRVEMVFHPTRLDEQKQFDFMHRLFKEIGLKQQQLKPYYEGPTFVSCSLGIEAIEALKYVNPLRAVHPLSFGGLTDLRNAPPAYAPKIPASSTRSTIKVGMFDGGVDVSVPHLQGYVEEDYSLAINVGPDPIGVAHGTAVAGAILYGELNTFAVDSRLAAPPVSVVSFRSLPTSNPADIDLYEAIDVIERAVPARKDIKVFNVSFGPRGPILDDTISRFTYALDSLSVAHKVLFVVAVGNDGEVAGLDRIQSPADMVHGLGVGAFSWSGDKKVPAAYSCKGPGRECGKIKPDVVAFGGCPNRPIHLLSTKHNIKQLAYGTSFAAPLVSRIGAQAAELFDRSSSLLARALLIHGASHPQGKPDHILGHGCISQDVNDVLTCDDYSVTVVFQGDITPKSVIRLPIPWPQTAIASGNVNFRWTVAGLPPIDPIHPSDYTAACIEDVFYPHDRRFEFSHPTEKNKKILDVETDKAEISKLLKQGWKKAGLPLTNSGNKYKDETQRRALDCKWEPLVRRELGKKASNVYSPFLTLQAIGRNKVPERFDYAVIVTVTAPKYVGDLYTDTRNQYPALAPIRVRTEAEIRVQI